MQADIRFSQLMCSRICHDLGGVIGSLAGVLELVDGPGEALELGRETATELRQRLRLYSAAWGSTPEDMTRDGIAELLKAAPAAARVRFDLDGLAAGQIAGEVVKLVLNAALLAAESLPRGGSVHLESDARHGRLQVRPEGRSAAWPAALDRLLSTGAALPNADAGPRQVLAPYLAAIAKAAGQDMRFIPAAPDAGPPPLLIAPAAR